MGKVDDDKGYDRRVCFVVESSRTVGVVKSVVRFVISDQCVYSVVEPIAVVVANTFSGFKRKKRSLVLNTGFPVSWCLCDLPVPQSRSMFYMQPVRSIQVSAPLKKVITRLKTNEPPDTSQFPP